MFIYLFICSFAVCGFCFLYIKKQTGGTVIDHAAWGNTNCAGCPVKASKNLTSLIFLRGIRNLSLPVKVLLVAGLNLQSCLLHPIKA